MHTLCVELRSPAVVLDSRASVCFCVYGKQTTVRFFPHEAKDLEPAIALLTASDVSRGAAGEDEDGAGAWEVR